MTTVNSNIQRERISDNGFQTNPLGLGSYLGTEINLKTPFERCCTPSGRSHIKILACTGLTSWAIEAPYPRNHVMA